MSFQKAVVQPRNARVVIFGPSGSGKTHLALHLAEKLAGATTVEGTPNNGVAMINTEGERGMHYAGVFNYDIATLDKYGIGGYLEAWRAARDSGYAALVVDSMSQFWSGEGGILEQGGKSIDSWDKVKNPLVRRFVNSVHIFPGHVVVTMRSKTELVEEEKNGKKVFVAKGTTFVFKEGVPYEFDLVIQIDQDHRAEVLKAPPGSGLDRWSGDSLDVELTNLLLTWSRGES